MNGKAVAGIAIAIAFLAVFAAAVLPTTLPWPVAAPGMAGIGVQIWEVRTIEVLLQAFILLGGVVAILLLLGTRHLKEAVP